MGTVGNKRANAGAKQTLVGPEPTWRQWLGNNC